MEASSPLGSGKICSDETVNLCAKEEGISVAELCLAYVVNKGVTILPKTSNIDRLKSNYESINIVLTEKTMNILDRLPYIGGLGLDSDEVIDFANL